MLKQALLTCLLFIAFAVAHSQQAVIIGRITDSTEKNCILL